MESELAEKKLPLRGLNGWQLKCVAMLFMTIDHIGLYSIVTCDPFYAILRILGRIAAPVFLYLCVEGIRHTRSRWFYLKKLYVMGILSSALAFVLFTLFPSFYYNDTGMTGLEGSLKNLQSSNMFFTFFIVVLMITSGEQLRQAIRQRNVRKTLRSLLCLALPVILIPIKLFVMNLTDDMVAGITGNYHYEWYGWFAGSFFPSLLDSAYTCLFVILGYFWYLVKDRQKQMAALLVLSALGMLNVVFCQGEALYGGWLQVLFWGMFEYPQCFMILAIPFLYCYNGARGRQNQWPCYLYYPVHIAVFATIGLLIGNTGPSF